MDAAEAPFRYGIDKLADDLYEIRYIGYMQEHDVEHLDRTDKLLAAAPGPVGLYYDTALMTGFHRSQVQRHATVYTRHRANLTGIGVTGANTVVRFGAITVSVISKLRLKTFDLRAEALAWLETLRREKASR
jgi:hypothetical protein